MSERQIPELVGNLVRLQNHFGSIPGRDRQWVIQNTEEAISLFAAAVRCRADGLDKTQRKFLRQIDSLDIASVAATNYTDYFGRVYHRYNDASNPKDPRSIRLAGDQFGEQFKKDFRKQAEEASEPATIKIFKITGAAVTDSAIWGRRVGEISLGQFFLLLMAQGNGEPGPMLTNGWPNVAFIRDSHGGIVSVKARLLGFLGWHVDSFSMAGGDPVSWNDGGQVLAI